MRFTGVGIQFALVFMIFLFGGIWLDDKLGAKPWFTILGTLVGGAAAFYVLYMEVFVRGKDRDDGET